MMLSSVFLSYCYISKKPMFLVRSMLPPPSKYSSNYIHPTFPTCKIRFLSRLTATKHFSSRFSLQNRQAPNKFPKGTFVWSPGSSVIFVRRGKPRASSDIHQEREKGRLAQNMRRESGNY